jgi:hypothetical protein
MKTKEELAKEYRKELVLNYDCYTYVAGNECEKSYISGYEAGQPKWISVEERTPENDKTVLVWINNIENPQWSNYGLCSYINGKWYCKGGRESHEIVTDWCQTPARK